jgi:hypothetical protein
MGERAAAQHFVIAPQVRFTAAALRGIRIDALPVL